MCVFSRLYEHAYFQVGFLYVWYCMIVYICLHMCDCTLCMCRCWCVHTCMGAQGWCQVSFSVIFSFTYWGKVCFWSQLRADWLSLLVAIFSEYPLSPCSWVLGLQVTVPSPCCWGSKVQPSHLPSKESHHWPILPAPQWIFIMPFFSTFLWHVSPCKDIQSTLSNITMTWYFVICMYQILNHLS